MENKTLKKIGSRFAGFLVAIFIFMIIIGFSYAYWRKNITQESPNTITTLNCLSASITDTTNAITLSDTFPISTSEGMEMDPYTFQITNNCSNYIKVAINLEVLNTTTMSSSNVRVSLNSSGVTYSNSRLVTNYNSATATIDGATAYTLNSGTYIAGSGTKSFDLRSWMDESTTTAQGANKVFNAKITLSYIPIESYKTNGEAFAWAHSGETTDNGGMELIKQPVTTQLKKTTEYRYYGQNPNNYVSFNNELWRIIGVFETENESGNLEYRLKLIKNGSIGEYSWDTSASTINLGKGINEWSQSDLMKLLNPGYESNIDLDGSGTNITVNNSLYYTKSSETCYNNTSNATTTCDFTTSGLGETAKALIDKAKFYTAGWSTSSVTPQQFYTYERGNNVVLPGTTCSGDSCNDYEERTTSWTGYVGLMYLSDYGYAADPNYCARSITMTNDNYHTNTPACYLNNWLWNSSLSKWTMTTDTTGASSVFYASYGGISGSVSGGTAFASDPVLYLKSSINISGGTGTVTDPYTLSI